MANKLDSTDGVVRNPNAAKGRGCKNWIATVLADRSKPGGLDRKFWKKPRRGFYEVPAELKVGDVIEFAGDSYNSLGKKHSNRIYGIVEAVTKSELFTTNFFDTAAEAFDEIKKRGIVQHERVQVTPLGQVKRDHSKPIPTVAASPQKPKETVQPLKPLPQAVADKFSDGAFVIWNSRLNAAALDPQDVRDMALAYGLPESLVPEYAGDRAIVSRVIDRNASKLKRKGWVLSALKRHNNHVLLTIHKTDKDPDARLTDLPQVGTIEWLAEPKDNNGGGWDDSLRGDHEVAKLLNTEFQQLRGKIAGTDWSISLVGYLQSECAAVSWRDDGRVYWVPPYYIDRVKELQGFLKLVGVNLAIAEIDGEVKESVQEVVVESLNDQVENFLAEVEAFNGKQKPSTYQDRLEQYHTLVKKATVWKETHKAAAGVYQDAIDKLELLSEKVDELLEERKQIRVKRDGTIEYL